MTELVFGNITGVKIGQIFENRRALHDAGVHRPLQSGIQGRSKAGACSIVLSGGYEDDEDYLDEILYTGDSGRDPTTGKQVENQRKSPGNLGLIVSCKENLPVRVVRGSQIEYGPENGYRFDGLYYVKSYHYVEGKEGFFLWRYVLVSEQNFEYLENQIIDSFPSDYEAPERKKRTSLTPLRDKAISDKVKKFYNRVCQVCNVPLKGNITGNISIGAHIKPVGRPHNGPDVIENILCLCPNHHSLFDEYGFTINEQFELIGLVEKLPRNKDKILRVDKKHKINPEFLRYHNEKYFELSK